jgi:trimethylamine--corrinoid protein Co-methyltransferase
MENNLIFRPSLRVLNGKQIRKLHVATAMVLERTGVKVTHPQAREIFAGGGARLEDDRVRIPREMLERAIKKAPSRIALGNRKGEEAVVLEDDASWFGATLDNVYYFDPETGRRRQLTLDDCRKIVELTSALSNFTWSMTFGTISDVRPDFADRHAARQALTYSEKPVVFSSNNVGSLRDIYEMARIVTGNERCFEKAPPAASFVTTISPLVIPDHVAEQMMFCAKHGIPQVCYAGIQAGSTAPMTFAGTVVQGNAETLACLVFNQLVKPGSAVIYGHFSTIMDMRSSIFSFGAPEMSLMVAAQSQIARHYNLPFYGTAGCSDSKLPDSQAAAEAVFSCLSSALGCAGLVHDSGLLEYGTMISPEFMVLVNEILHMVGQYMRGLDVSDEALALDIIDSVGPGNHYLMMEHTRKHFHEAWYSQLFDRNRYDTWSENGSKDLRIRVRERTLALMAHQPEPLEKEKAKELDKMSRHWT